jgi:ankyrin repeat protein
MRIGCLPCARETLRKVEPSHGEDARLLLAGGTLLSLQGRRAAAEVRLSRAIGMEADPLGKARGELALAEHYARFADLDAAERAIVRATQHVPELLRPQLELGRFQLFRRGDAAAARRTAERAQRARNTVEGRRLVAMADYLAWAQSAERTRSTKGLGPLLQKAVVCAEEAFLLAAGFRALTPLARALASAGAVRDLEARDGDGNTALMLAARGGNEELVSWLLRRGAVVEQENQSGARALSYAAARGHSAVVRTLLERGAGPGFVDLDGNTPLSLAVFGGHGATARLLLDRKAPLGAGRWSAADLLDAAAGNGDLDAVTALVRAGADPNGPAKGGALPLVSAVRAGARGVVAFLLDHGADPGLRVAGRTAIDYARDAGDGELIRLLSARAREAA